jgi:hypothetical protein
MQIENKCLKKIVLLTDGGKEGKIPSEIISKWNNQKTGKFNITILPFKIELQSYKSINDHLIQQYDQLIGIFGSTSFKDNSISASCIEQIISNFSRLNKSVTIYLSKYGIDPYGIIPEQLSDFKNFAVRMQSAGYLNFFSSIYDLKEKITKQLYVDTETRKFSSAIEVPPKSEKEIDEQMNRLIENPSFPNRNTYSPEPGYFNEDIELNVSELMELHKLINTIVKNRNHSAILMHKIRKMLSPIG